MKIKHLSPAFEQRIHTLRRFIREDTLYGAFIGKVLDELEAEYNDDPVMLMNTLLESQRLLHIHVSSLAQNEALYEYYTSNALPSFYQYKSPPVETQLIEHLADKIYNMRTGYEDYGLLQTDNGVRSIAIEIVQKFLDQKDRFDVQFADTSFKNTLLNIADNENIQALAEYYLDIWSPVTRRMGISPMSHLETPPDADKNKQKFFSSALKPLYERIKNGEVHFTISSVPTPKDAEMDGIPYEDYLTLFFEMCDQPWELIDAAQRRLIEILNAGKTLHFTNSDGTDLHMDIDGFTFANSVIARNVPGAEVFSAPRKKSVTGKIVAKGKFIPSGKKDKIVEDITLIFKDGKCVKYSAFRGEDVLKEIIETDQGSAYIGEIGIGTNPHLKRHVANITMVEKISGSFHVALGDAYTQTEYMGVPVKLDNGNRSLIHWDITTMLFGKHGKIYLDGALISDNGLFIDQDLSILNKGWEAVPVADRPEYWQDYDFANRTGLPPNKT